MSELKVYHCNEWHNKYTEFYLKSEADKVIAEKDAEIAQLKDKLQAAEKQTENLINSASSLMLGQERAALYVKEKYEKIIAEKDKQIEELKKKLGIDQDEIKKD